jgi:cytoskeleton protein RodZ
MMATDFRIYLGLREQYVGSFGEHLRREREMRGISLDEIATATKISARNLQALEDEKFKQLPGGIFNKGFVRAYAKFLGIDQEQMVAEYETASQETETAREQKLKDEFSKAEFRRQKKDDNQEISLEPKSQWGSIAVIVLIAALVYGGYNYYQRRKLDKLQQAHTQRPVVTHIPPVQPPPAPTTVPNAATTAQPVLATANSHSPQTPAVANAAKPSESSKANPSKLELPKADLPKTASQKNETAATPTSATGTKPQTPLGPAFELKIKVNRQSWVSVKADGKTIVNTTLNPGTERSFKATDKIEMILGNSSGVEVSYNGKPVENLSTGQDVRKLIFTPSGYE